MLGVKRKALSVETKLNVIKFLMIDVAKRFDLIYSSVNSMCCNRDEIKIATEMLNSKHMKKVRKPTHEDLDEVLLKWFTQQNIPVSGPVLEVKAPCWLYWVLKVSTVLRVVMKLLTRLLN